MPAAIVPPQAVGVEWTQPCVGAGDYRAGRNAGGQADSAAAGVITMVHQPDEQRLRAYAVRQGLTVPRGSADVVTLATHLLGFQDQIRGTVRQSAQARSAAVTGDDVERGLFTERRLVRTWTVRGTVHVIAAADLPLFQAALLPEWQARWSRFLDRHVTPTQRTDASEAALALLADGPATRTELLVGVRRLLAVDAPWLDYLFSSWGGVLKDFAYRGEIVHGPTRGSELLFARTDWLAPASSPTGTPGASVDPATALASLLVRYLTAYGPATLADFGHWSGVNMVRVRQAYQLATAAVSELPGRLLIVPAAAEPDGATTGVHLLPRFDPYLLAHRGKFYLDPAHSDRVFPGAAQVAATVIAGGRVVGTWRARGQGKRLSVETELFAPLPPDLPPRALTDAEDETRRRLSGLED